MKNYMSEPVEIRQVFRISKLPFLIMVYLNSQSQRFKNWKGAIIKKACQLLFRLFYILKIPSAGIFFYKNGVHEVPVNFNGRNMQFRSIYSPKYRDARYEPETFALLDYLMRPDGMFFDVGSNWGHFSLYVASKNHCIQVHAFEAMPETFDDLNKIVSQTGIGSQVSCHHVALSDKSGFVEIGIPDGINSGRARIGKSKASIKVESRKLDEFESLKPTVIKIDAEGHEEHILQGGKELLAKHKPMVIFESWKDIASPHNTIGPFDVLENSGYFFFQPVLFCEKDGLYIAIGYGDYSEQDLLGVNYLALYPFDKKERFLFEKQFNVLACHESRLSEIQNIII